MSVIFNNIPKMRLLIVMLGALSFLFGSTPIPSENTFLFCLKSSINPIEITRSGNTINVDNVELNDFIRDKGIINLEKWIPQATEMDRDGDIYLNRIYRAYISDEQRSNISNIINEINSLSIIKYSENEYIRN